MLETDLQHGVRRGRLLRSERIARRYENVANRVLMAERDLRASGPLVLEKVSNAV